MNLQTDFEETISMCDITKWGLKMIIQHSPSTGSHSYKILTFSPWHQHSHQIRIVLCLLRRNTNFTEKPNTWVTSQLFKLFNNPRKKYTHTEWHTSSIFGWSWVILNVTCWDILTDDPGKGGGVCQTGVTWVDRPLQPSGQSGDFNSWQSQFYNLFC